jgi:hypothetical protein
MRRSHLVLAAVAVLVVSGLVHGFCTQRWHSSRVFDDAVARVGTVPMTAGPWQSTHVDVDAPSFQQTRAAGYWMRRYTKSGVPGSFAVILMCGQARYMAIHTPDLCYRGGGFEMVSEPTRETVAFPGGQAEMWTTYFRLGSKTTGTTLRIWWAWSCQGGWQAPDAPRWTFGGAPYLYKLYIVYEPAADESRDSVAGQFLPELLAGLQDSLLSTNTRKP